MAAERWRQVAPQLRRSYRCDCVERHDTRPGRVTLAVLEQDIAENWMVAVEGDTGVRPDGCPWRALRDPFVVRVVNAYAPWKIGHPIREERLRRGVEAFHRAVENVMAADMRREKKKREAKQKAPPVTTVRRRR